MADKTFIDVSGLPVKMRDMGDGTWAEIFAGVSSGSGTTADQVQGNAAAAATDAGNPVKVGGVFMAPPTVLTTGQRGDMQMDSNGNIKISLMASGSNNAIVAASDNTDAFGTASTSTRLMVIARNTMFNGVSWDRDTKATSVGRIASCAATTNATSVKASAGTVHSIDLYNAAATVKFLKLYNKASAPTVGTDTPVRTIALKPTDKTTITFPKGLYFATGIALALTGAAADADTTALAAADVVGLNVDYA